MGVVVGCSGMRGMGFFETAKGKVQVVLSGKGLVAGDVWTGEGVGIVRRGRD